MTDEDGAARCGIIAYDLKPPDPGAAGQIPAYTPFRPPGQIPARPRYVPPPLPEGFARVELSDDYYLGPGWDDWSGKDAEYPARVFDIPAEQRGRWEQAQAAYAAMQEEIAAMRAGRLGAPGWTPPGWARKAPCQVQP